MAVDINHAYKALKLFQMQFQVWEWVTPDDFGTWEMWGYMPVTPCGLDHITAEFKKLRY